MCNSPQQQPRTQAAMVAALFCAAASSKADPAWLFFDCHL